MAKVQIEIDIPNGHEVDTVRHTNSHYDGTLVYCVTVKATKPFLINGVPSDWPEWLTCDWVAKDKNEAIFGYDGNPPERLLGSTWSVSINQICGRIFGTTLTIPGPFEQSLRENPRRKK